MGESALAVDRGAPASLVLRAARVAALLALVAVPRAVVAQPAPTTDACPAAVTVAARCERGRDASGAFWIMAVPAAWNHVLIVHAHGGPEPNPPRAARADEDLTRWAIEVNAGYAFAASTYHEAGFAVRAAAADTEGVRTLFVARYGQPRRTILHGQSWGAGVALRATDLIRVGGRFPYDAVLLTSGAIGGGTRSYDFRLDLRVVYEALCGNHPRPDEPSYPLNIGLPANATLSEDDLVARWTACVGTDDARKPAQAATLKTLSDVIRFPASSLLGHLAFGTYQFRAIVQRYGGSPFGNVGVRYTGSPDDDTLNRTVRRESPDADAARRFAEDVSYLGNLPVPVLSLHAINDPTAMVELESELRERVAHAGRSDLLVQAFVDFDRHSYWSDPVYVAALAELLDWIDHGRRPSPATLDARCTAVQPTFGGQCRVKPDYVPQPLAAREYPR